MRNHTPEGSSAHSVCLCLSLFVCFQEEKNTFNTIRMRVIVLIQLAFDLRCQSQSGRRTPWGLQIKHKGPGLISPLVLCDENEQRNKCTHARPLAPALMQRSWKSRITHRFWLTGWWRWTQIKQRLQRSPLWGEKTCPNCCCMVLIDVSLFVGRIFSLKCCLFLRSEGGAAVCLSCLPVEDGKTLKHND